MAPHYWLQEVGHGPDQGAVGRALPGGLHGGEVLVHDGVDAQVIRGADGAQGAFMDADDPFRDGRVVHREIARDLQAPQQGAHQRNDGGVAGRPRDAQVELGVELEEAVFAGHDVTAGEQRLLRVDRLLQPGEIVFACVQGRQLRDARLDHPAGLEYACHLASAQLGLRAQQVHRDVAGGDDDAVCPYRQHAGVGEHPEGLAQRPAADPHGAGQMAHAALMAAAGM
jgi:hypothetical protein